MEKWWYVADSYKNMTQIGEPFEKETGKKYIRVKDTCPRCSGLGIIVARVENGQPIPIPVDGGVCYQCGGSGIQEKDVRAYTEKEYTRMQAANERARAKKAAEREAKIQERLDNAETYKHEAALKLGFGDDNMAYLVYGDDTFAIKDELKAMGARFNPILKWYFSKEVELPEGYKLCPVSFDEVYDYNAASRWVDYKENAKDTITRKFVELKGPSTAEYYPAAERERIRNITAKVTAIRGFEGLYGYTSVYTFTSGNYVFVWMTSKCDLDLAVGDTVDLTGTIRKFDEYMGVKQTHLNRCIVNKISE